MKTTGVAWAVVASAVTIFTLPARADVLVSNTGEPTRGVTGVSRDLWAGQSFSTDGNAHKLMSIDLLLGALVGDPALVAELDADAAGRPGSTLASFSLAGIGTGTPALFTLSGSPLDLNPDTTYWIELGAIGNGRFGWAYAEGNAQTGPGFLREYGYSSNAGGSWDSFGTDNPYKVRVNVTSAVPEPAAATMLLIGLFGLAARRAGWPAPSRRAP